MDVETREEKLTKNLENWRNDEPQRDDITFIGIKF